MRILLLADLIVAALVVVMFLATVGKSTELYKEKYPDASNKKRNNNYKYDRVVSLVKLFLTALCPVLNVITLYIYIAYFDKICERVTEKLAESHIAQDIIK